MAPAWTALARDLKDVPDVIIARFDAGGKRDKPSQYGVKGFPALKLYTKADKTGIDYGTKRRDVVV